MDLSVLHIQDNEITKHLEFKKIFISSIDALEDLNGEKITALDKLSFK